MSTERNLKTDMYISIRMPKGAGKSIKCSNVIVEESNINEAVKDMENLFTLLKNQTK